MSLRMALPSGLLSQCRWRDSVWAQPNAVQYFPPKYPSGSGAAEKSSVVVMMAVLVGCEANAIRIRCILNTYSGPVESGFTLECYTIIKSISCHFTFTPWKTSQTYRYREETHSPHMLPSEVNGEKSLSGMSSAECENKIHTTCVSFASLSVRQSQCQHNCGIANTLNSISREWQSVVTGKSSSICKTAIIPRKFET